MTTHRYSPKQTAAPQGRSTPYTSSAQTRQRHPSSDERPIAKSLQEYGRGIAGGMLFSLPLLYTMEVWWAGFSIHPWR